MTPKGAQVILASGEVAEYVAQDPASGTHIVKALKPLDCLDDCVREVKPGNLRIHTIVEECQKR